MDKDFTLKNKIKVMTPLEYLYEIQFFNYPSEKVIFDENIKSIINFLFERISFYYNEKIKKEKEKNKELFYYRSKKKRKLIKTIWKIVIKKELKML